MKQLFHCQWESFKTRKVNSSIFWREITFSSPIHSPSTPYRLTNIALFLVTIFLGRPSVVVLSYWAENFVFFFRSFSHPLFPFHLALVLGAPTLKHSFSIAANKRPYQYCFSGCFPKLQNSPIIIIFNYTHSLHHLNCRWCWIFIPKGWENCIVSTRYGNVRSTHVLLPGNQLKGSLIKRDKSRTSNWIDPPMLVKQSLFSLCTHFCF